MRVFSLLLLLLCAACAAPAAPSPTATIRPSAVPLPSVAVAPGPSASPLPSAFVPGNATAAPPAALTGEALARTATALATPTHTPTPLPAAAPAGPELALGYGEPYDAVFIPGAPIIAVSTSAGVLLIDRGDLTTRAFFPVERPDRGIAVSPDGTLLAVQLIGGAAASEVGVFSLAGDLRLSVPGLQPRFSPDGRLLIVEEYSFENQTWRVRAYSLADGSEQEPPPTPQPFGAQEVPGRSIAISPDGSLAAACGDSGLAVYPIRAGLADTSAPTLQAGGFCMAVAFSADGAQVHAMLDSTLRSWSLPAGASLADQAAQPAEINRFGPGGQIFAATAAGGDAPSSTRLIRVRDGAEIYADGPEDGSTLSFSPEGEQALLITIAGELRLIDIAAGQIHTRALAGYTRAARSPDERTIAAGRGGPQIDLWPAGPAEQPARSLGSHAYLNGLRDLEFSATQIIAEGEFIPPFGGPQQLGVYIWEASGDPAGDPRERTVGESANLPEQRVVWDYEPGRDLLAWAEPAGELLLSAAGAEPQPVETRAGPISALAFSPARPWLAIGDEAGELRIIDVKARLPLYSGPISQGAPIRAMAWSANGEWLALSLGDGAVLVWQAIDDDPAREVGGLPEGPILALALSPDGGLLAVGGEGGLVVQRLSDGAELLRAPGLVRDLDFIAREAQILAVRNGRVEVWNLP